MLQRPELCPGPRWGSLQCSLDPLAGFRGGETGEGQGGEDKKEWAGKERGKGSEKKDLPQQKIDKSTNDCNNGTVNKFYNSRPVDL